MKCSEYAKKRGAILPIVLIAKIAGYSAIGLNVMYKREDFGKLDKIIDESEARFKSICKTKKGG